MRKNAVFCVLCILNSIFLSLITVPTASAQGAGWGTPERLDTGSEGGAGDAMDPQVGIDSGGNAIAVWNLWDGVRSSILANRYIVGMGWGAPEIVGMSSIDAYYPQVAVEPGGNAMVVWEQSDGVLWNIHASRYVVGLGWGTPELIETNDVGDAMNPQVAVDPNGNAVAVWEQHDGGRTDISANRYAAGIGWGTPELIETNDAGSAMEPQVVIDPSGNATAVWEQWNGTSTNGYANRYIVGTGWGTPELIETNDEGPVLEPQVAVDPSGTVMAVWKHYIGFVWKIWANRYIVGTGWGTPELVETDDTGEGQSPQVAVDPSGNAVAVWREWNGPRVNISANRYTVGTGWGTAEVIVTNDTEDAFSPQVAVDSSGNAVAVWDQYNSSRIDIYSNRYAVGTGWGTAGPIETNNAGDAEKPQIAIAPGGNAMAVWQYYNGTRIGIYANRYVVGTGWGTPKLVEAYLGDAVSPKIAVDPSGNATAVWMQWDGAHYSIYANRFSVGMGWGMPELIETENKGDAEDLEIAADPGGNAVVVWAQWNGSRFSIMANRYAVGTGWGTAEYIETDDTMDAEYPHVAIDPTGTAIAVWAQGIGGHMNIYSNRYIVGTGWGTPELAGADDTEQAAYPQVAVDTAGNAIVMWMLWNGTYQFNISANRYVVGAGWGTAERIATYAEDQRIAIDPSGNAMAVWMQDNGSRSDIWANRYIVGTGWGTAELIETNNLGIAVNPTVAVDPGGDATAVWTHRVGSRYNTWANHYVVGTGWGTAGPIETNDAGDALFPEVAVDQIGNAVAVWQQAEGARKDIWANRYVAGKGWRTAVLIEANDAVDAREPQVAVDTSGNATAVWWLDEPTGSQIWANRFTATDLIPPVAEAGPDQTVTAGDLVTFDGSGSTDNMGIVSYNWTFDDGGLRTLWGVSPTYSFHDVGVFTVTLTVVDEGAYSDTDIVVITVNPAPDAERPVADAGPDQSVVAGTLVAFDGTGSTDNVGITNYMWTFNDGGTRTLYGVSPTYRFNAAGVFVVTLTVRDAAGNTDVDEVDITVAPPPDTQPPIADAGPSRSIPVGMTIILDGSGSTDNVGITNYTWSFYDGGMEYRYGVMFARQFNRVSSIAVTLTVRDAAGNFDTDTIVITVDPLPDTEDPVADAGPDQDVVAGTLVTFDGSGSTDNVGVTNYIWTFDDGGAQTLYGVAPTYRFDSIGTFVVTLTTRDAAGNNDSDFVVVTVTPPPDTEDPVANAGPNRSILAGTTIVLDGSASMDNVGIVNYTWTFVDGGIAKYRYAMMWEYRFDNVDAITIALTVKDAAGLSDIDTVLITVNPLPDTEDPVADAGPDQTVVAGTLVIFDGSGSTDNVGVTNRTWTFDDGGPRTLYGVVPGYTFDTAGVFVVTLTVRDAAGNSDVDYVVITVNPVPSDTERPTAEAGPGQSVDAGTSVTFDGSGSADNVGVTNYTWMFNDGGARTLYGVSPTCTFTNAGMFVVTLTVRDAAGSSDADVVVITVNPVTPTDTVAPAAEAGPDQSIVAGSTTTVDGSGSTDDVGVVNYTWTFTYNGAIRTLYGQMAKFKFDVTGVYTVTLTVRDAAGNSDTDTVMVSVTAAPGGGTTEKEVISPMTIAVIAILAILAAILAVMLALARRKKKGRDLTQVEEAEAEEEEAPGELTEEEK